MKAALRGFARWIAGMFEEKRDYLAFGDRRASMTRWQAWTLTLAMSFRLVYRPPVPLNWPEALVLVCLMFMLVINRKADAAPSEVVLKAVTDVARAPWQTKEASSAPPPTPAADTSTRELATEIPDDERGD